jgi:hypothetical protein
VYLDVRGVGSFPCARTENLLGFKAFNALMTFVTSNPAISPEFSRRVFVPSLSKHNVLIRVYPVKGLNAARIVLP